MKIEINQHLLDQLNDIVRISKELVSNSKCSDYRDIDEIDLQKTLTMARAAVERISGNGSPYSNEVKDICNFCSTAKQPDFEKHDSLYSQRRSRDMRRLFLIQGVVESLRNDLERGYLQSVKEFIHAELFADFVEMATHLLEEGYKDPAAVIIGGTLEAHLRQLCEKNDVITETTTNSFRTCPKRTDQLNAELTKKTVYSKLDQKNITAWLDLRNKAAHGRYDEYSKEQVALMIAGVKNFMIRVPA